MMVVQTEAVQLLNMTVKKAPKGITAQWWKRKASS